jgi:hypothetical protein
VDALARTTFAELDGPAYDTSLRWVMDDEPAAAADATRRHSTQLEQTRFRRQYLWMFGR